MQVLLRYSLIILVFFLFLPFLSTASKGQNLRPPEEYVKATHRSWQVKCQRVYADDNESFEENCFMLQENADRDNTKITSIILILKSSPDSYLMRITVPLGVYLPKKLSLRIDDKHIGKIPYFYCYSGGCVSESDLPDVLVEKLKRGNKGSLIFNDLNLQELEMPISLSGFTKAYEVLTEASDE